MLAALLLGLPASDARGASRAISLVAGIDLTLSCTQTSPSNPAFFSDGETITLECLITNEGTDPSGQQTTLAAVFSDDEIVDSSDKVILSNTTVASIAGGASVSLTLSGSVQHTIPGPLKLCTKIDVNLASLDNQAGRIQEADEGNNVQCSDVEVLSPRRDLIVAPGSILLAPDARDQSNFRAGLELQVTYGSRNQGNGAIRASYSNAIRIGTSTAAALADPNSRICSKVLLTGQNPFQAGGSTVSVTHGFSDPNNPASLNFPDTCKIPFNLAAGTYALVVQLDSLSSISEQTPTGAISPAEANNTLAVPINIAEPLAPQFRIQDDSNIPGDQRVEVFGPGTKKMLVRIASARDLAGYSFRLTWDPPGLISVGDPNAPAGDPNQIEFSTFLETNGRVQDCNVTDLQNLAGQVEVRCTTSGGGAGASTETPETLLTITWTAAAPGEGDLTISDMSAETSSGQAFSGLTALNGIVVVSGVGDIAVIDAAALPEAYPGVSFATSWDVRNRGFGPAFPVSTALVLSRDAIYDDPSAAVPDVVACSFNEPVPIPPLTTIPRDLTSCILAPSVRPGLYTAMFQPLPPAWDPNNRTTEVIAFPSRFVALRTSGKEKVAETSPAPDQLGGTTGGFLARERKYPARSIASVGSGSRDLNWIVRLVRSGQGKQLLELVSFPKANSTPQDIMTRLRLPKEDRAVLGAADVDGDGDDELILLQESRKGGQVLDFRRIDFAQRKPEVCQSAAVTGALAVPVVAATGIQFDLDPEDELAILTADGALNIYDLTLTGSPPPPSPCRPIPTVIHGAPATVDLTLRAGDASFSSTGDEALAICALDWQLDGVEEIGSLHEDPSGAQALRIFEAPAAPGGTAVLLADDPAFGGTAERARAHAITCTR